MSKKPGTYKLVALPNALDARIKEAAVCGTAWYSQENQRVAVGTVRYSGTSEITSESPPYCTVPGFSRGWYIGTLRTRIIRTLSYSKQSTKRLLCPVRGSAYQ
jgi:hypothetical protein